MSRKTAYVIPKVGVRALAGFAAVVGAMLIPAEPARADHDSGVHFFFGAAFPFPVFAPVPVPLPVVVPVHGYGGGPVFYDRPHRRHHEPYCRHKHHQWRRHHARHDGWDRGGHGYSGRRHGRHGDWDDDDRGRRGHGRHGDWDDDD